MPREYIRAAGMTGNPKQIDIATEGGFRIKLTDSLPPDVSVAVGWGKPGFVQVATVVTGKEHSYNPDDGWYVNLTREQINDFIRLLRKARDGAYGREDE